MNVLIIDDEVNNRNLIGNLLKKHLVVKEVKMVNSAIEGVALLKTFTADVIFLDVEMPGGSGFNFLDAIPDRKFKVIFVTAHEKYAIQALRAKAYDYLLKPVDIDQFDRIMESLQNNEFAPTKTSGIDRIVINTQNETYFLKPKNIIKVSSAGNYCIYHMANGKEIVASYILKKASQTLPEELFIRVHNSAIINISFIEKITKVDGFEIIMKDGSSVPLSRRRKEEVLSRIAKP